MKKNMSEHGAMMIDTGMERFGLEVMPFPFIARMVNALAALNKDVLLTRIFKIKVI